MSRPLSRLFLLVAPLVALTACGGGDDEATTVAITDASSAPVATEPAAVESTTTEVVAESMRGKRYCEFLLLAPTENGIVATVYNTFPLNDCPADQWASIDPPAVAQAEGVVLAMANTTPSACATAGGSMLAHWSAGQSLSGNVLYTVATMPFSVGARRRNSQ